MDLKKIEIGVVGAGFVGNAVIKAFEKKYVVNVLDTIEDKCTHYCMSSFLNSSDIIFVCVPTPMGKDGECNTSIVVPKKMSKGNSKIIDYDVMVGRKVNSSHFSAHGFCSKYNHY